MPQRGAGRTVRRLRVSGAGILVAVVAGLATSACGGGRTETAYSGDQTVTNEWDRKNVQCDGPGDLLIKHIIAVTVTNADSYEMFGPNSETNITVTEECIKA